VRPGRRMGSLVRREVVPSLTLSTNWMSPAYMVLAVSVQLSSQVEPVANIWFN